MGLIGLGHEWIPSPISFCREARPYTFQSLTSMYQTLPDMQRCRRQSTSMLDDRKTMYNEQLWDGKRLEWESTYIGERSAFYRNLGREEVATNTVGNISPSCPRMRDVSSATSTPRCWKDPGKVFKPGIQWNAHGTVCAHMGEASSFRESKRRGSVQRCQRWVRAGKE